MYSQICITLILSNSILTIHAQNPPLNKLINYLPDITQNYSITQQIYNEISNKEKLKASKQVFKPPLLSGINNQQFLYQVRQKSSQSKIQKAITQSKNTLQTQNKDIRIIKYPQFQVTNAQPRAQKIFVIQDIKQDNERKFEQNQIFKDSLKQLKTTTDVTNTKTRPQKTVIQKQLFNFLRPSSKKRQRQQLNLSNTQNAQKNYNFQQSRNNDQKPANNFQQVQNQHFNKKNTFSQPFNKPAAFVKNQDHLQQMIVTNLQKSQLAYKLRNKQIKIENLPNVHIPQKQILSHSEVQNVQTQQSQNDQKESQQQSQIFSKNVIKSLFSILLIGSIFVIALSYKPDVNSKKQRKAYKPSQDQEIYLR